MGEVKTIKHIKLGAAFILLLVNIIFNWQCASAQKTTTLSNKTKIVYSGITTDAITDLQSCLNTYNAGEISITPVEIGNRTGQEFYLAVNDKRTIIQYTTQQSLENAIYTYLDMLGFRWYGPGDNWFIKPAKLPVLHLTGAWIKPSFRNRSFFGTGGLDFSEKPFFDPQNNYKIQWLAWKRRNRYNVDFNTQGHTGHAFYLQNKALLTANPNWFANTTGLQNGRIKIEIPAAVQAYKNWVRTVYTRTKTSFIALSVDPEDGRGGNDDPLPKNMKGISNHADKWWWLANEVSKDYTDNKNVVVTAYAYGDGGTNALVPSFKLRKNVYPVIIPYAFQKAYLPDEMIKVWAKSIEGNMGIYDYWNITQWSRGMPQFNIYDIPRKLKLWNKNKIDGIYLETTDAAGPMGHALWLAGQFQWNINADFEKLYRQYLTDCFGKAAGIMKTMFDRWSLNYQNAGEISLTFHDLNEAADKVGKNSPEWKRINELKAYALFIKLYYEHDGSKASRDKIFNYLYSIHHLMMVQTAAFVGQNYIAPFNPNKIEGRVAAINSSQIEKEFNATLKKVPAKFTISEKTFDPSKVKFTEPIPDMAWRFGRISTNFYFVAPFSGKVQMDAGAQGETSLKIFTDDQSINNEKIGKGNYSHTEIINNETYYLKKITFPVEKNKKYYVQLSNGFNRLKVNTQGIVLLKVPGQQDFDNFAYPVQYFYVPSDVTEIIFSDAEPEGTNGRGYLIAPNGEQLKRVATGVKDIYKVQVQPAWRGKIWTALFGHPTWSFKNIPNITSLQRFSYTE